MGKGLDYNIVNINISAAISNQELIIDGAKIIYLSGSQQLNVKLNENSADNIPLNPKERIVWPGRFNKLYFSGGPYPETITLLIASEPDFVLDSSSVNVDILNNQIRDDSYLYHSASELNAYITTDGINVTASNYGGIQLWNKSTTGKRILVRGVHVNVSDAVSIKISSIMNTRIDTFIPTAVLSTYDATISKCNNLNPNSVVEIWKGLVATAMSTIVYFRYAPLITGDIVFIPINPILLAPGEGVQVFSNSVLATTYTLTACFEFEGDFRMIKVINPYYVSPRIQQLNTVAAGIDTALKAHPKIQSVTGADILTYVASAATYAPYTDGELDYIANKIGTTIIEV